MFNKKSIGALIATIALSSLVIVPATAQGGYGQHQGNRDRDQQQHRNRNQGTWQIRNLVDQAERSSNAFRDAVEKRDRQTNSKNRRGNNNQERFFDELAPRVRSLDEAMEALRRAADNNRLRSGRDEMTTVLDRARSVDRFFNGNTFGNGNGYGNGNGNGNRRNQYTYTRSNNLDARWQDLRRDINAMANAYNMSPIGTRRG